MNRFELAAISGRYPWRFHLTIEGALESPYGGDNAWYVGKDGDGWFYGFQERGEITIFKGGVSEEEAIDFLLADMEPSLLAQGKLLPTNFEPPSNSKTITINVTGVTNGEDG